MVNSADPDQLASEEDLNCLQRQGLSGFSRMRVKTYIRNWCRPRSNQPKLFAIQSALLDISTGNQMDYTKPLSC